MKAVLLCVATFCWWAKQRRARELRRMRAQDAG